MNILDTIVEHKRVEILKRKMKRPLSNLEGFPFYKREVNSIRTDPSGLKPGIIAEFKRKSPSRGPINMNADPVEVARGYAGAGVAAMSILTDRDFFGGSFRDLVKVREAFPELVLLRKDFILDPYQLHESSAYGADMVLLIAAILEKDQVTDLAAEAGALGLNVLLEVHNEKELQKYHPSISLVGVNNRDLRTFRVDTGVSLDLIRKMPGGVLAVSESGISSTSGMEELFRAGYSFFLIGEHFMSQPDPGRACKEFLA